MALNVSSLESKVIAQLKAQGFKTDGEHAFAGKMAKAIAAAVVAEITENAQVQVTSGSSAGTYQIT